jgi:hypothetical protein
MPGLARAFLLPIVAEIIDSRSETAQSSLLPQRDYGRNTSHYFTIKPLIEFEGCRPGRA